MNKVFILAVTVSIFGLAVPAYAVKVYECVDDEGNVTYQDRCPTGTKPVSEKKYGTASSDDDESKSDISATMYRVPECESCEEIKEFLQLRKITLTEKNVADNVDLQTELKEKTGGELKVPVTIIGEKVIKGYSRQELLAALKDAGFVEPKQPASETSPAAPENTESDTGSSETEETAQ